jgi:hypothetical protein
VWHIYQLLLLHPLENIQQKQYGLPRTSLRTKSRMPDEGIVPHIIISSFCT